MANNKTLSVPQKNQLYGRTEDDKSNYVPDEWIQCDKKPTKLYQLDFDNGSYEITCPQSSYFIDEDTYHNYLKRDGAGNFIQDEQGNPVFDVQRYCNDAQIAPYLALKVDENNALVLDENGNDVYEATYKNHISCYDVSDSDLEMWEGHAEANDQFGSGGAKQYYVPEEEYSKLSKDENFVAPTILDEDRQVDANEAQEDVFKGREKNQALRNELDEAPMEEESQKSETLKKEAPSQNNDKPTMEETANENGLSSTNNNEKQNNVQMQDSELSKEKPTMQQTADEENLPEYKPEEENTNNLKQEATPSENNQTMRDVADVNNLPKENQNTDNTINNDTEIHQ